jgi:hypothetical protein
MSKPPKRQEHYALQNLEKTGLVIPPRRERENLKPGRVVHVCFALDDDKEGDTEQGVVEIVGHAPGGEYIGRLESPLSYVELDAGDEVRFGPENIEGFGLLDDPNATM